MKRNLTALAVAVFSLTVFAEKPLARIGVLTDTHVGLKGTFERLEQAFRLFRNKGVDTLVNLGDVANVYNADWQCRYAAIREKIFPEGIEEYIVYHNHDRVGFPGDDAESVKAFAAVEKNLKAANGRYGRFERGGCTFLVYPMFEDEKRLEKELDEACAAAKAAGRPVFVLYHVPPSTTVKGSGANGVSRPLRVFSKHPEIIALTGHVHGSLAHEGKIWQGAFTAVGFGTLKDPVTENADFHVGVIEIYEKSVVIRRYALSDGSELRPAAPWRIDLPYDPSKPRYSHAALASTGRVPAFAEDAAITVWRDGPRLGRLTVGFPAVKNAEDTAEYRVAVKALKDGVWTDRTVRVVPGDYAVPPAKRRGELSAVFLDGEFDAGEKVRLAVTPYGFWGNPGRSIELEYSVGELAGGWESVYEHPGEESVGSSLPLPGGIFSGEGVYRLVADISYDMPARMASGFQLIRVGSKERPFGKFWTIRGSFRHRFVFEFERPGRKGEWRIDFFRSGEKRPVVHSLKIERRPSSAAVSANSSPGGGRVLAPGESRYFEKFTDPVSGAVSYLLKPGILAHNQQSLYYTQKAMSDDGRFLVFSVAPDERVKGYSKNQHLAYIDFAKDEATVLEGFTGGPCMPYLDVKNDILYYIRGKNEPDPAMYRLDLRAAKPTSELVCRLPRSIVKRGERTTGYYTHLTMTADRRGVFLDANVITKDSPEKSKRERLSVLGVFDFTTGVFNEWLNDEYIIRHAAANPVRPGVALALEPYWQTHEEVHDCGRDGVCRRLLLLDDRGRKELIVGKVPPGGKPPVHVVHTEWTADGSGIYWCSYSNGVILHNIDTGAEEVLMKENCAVHCEMTDDNRYIVFDESAGERKFRGQSWKVGYYDRVTKRTCWVYTGSPELATPEKPSTLHPDPHPNFGMGGRYIIATMTVKPWQISLIVTPTDQFGGR